MSKATPHNEHPDEDLDFALKSSLTEEEIDANFADFNLFESIKTSLEDVLAGNITEI